MSKEDRVILIVGAGAETVPGIKRAKDMGLYVVVSDMSPDAPGCAIADKSIVASTYDVEATVEAAKAFSRNERPINGVISIAADVPLAVASVACELGLPGIPVEAARIASNKVLMKEVLSAEGIAVPWFHQVASAGDLLDIAKERCCKCIVKPVDSRGSRGVVMLSSLEDCEFAYNYALKFSPSGQVMVEEYVEGPQVSTESVLLEKRSYTLGFSDRNYKDFEKFAPHIIEDGGQQPSFLSDREREVVSGLAVRAGRALGIKNGIVKGDMVLSADGPKVIEVAPRLSGGWFCTDQIPLATGVDLVGVAIRLALGETPSPQELTKTENRAVAIRYFFPAPGRVVEIRNVAKFDNTEWVHRIGFFVKVGDVVCDVSDHTGRSGYVITTGRTLQEAVDRADEVVREVEIITRAL